MSRPCVLVLNAGSSSLKYQVIDPVTGDARVRGHAERIDATGFERALARLEKELTDAGIAAGDLLAVGHRVVHGGLRYRTPTLIDEGVLADIVDLSRLAPLHNPAASVGIRSARTAYPGVPQVAVFDTAFFADLPDVAATYAIDRAIAEREGIRRYGMHGISHHYVSVEVAGFLGRDPRELDQVVLHLGNGASAAAIRGGRPLDTSMGLTPLEGLVMGTRAGDLDPGVLLHLLRHGGADGESLGVDALEDLLHHRAGLQGLAGRQDFRELLDAVDGGDDVARAAYDIYCQRIRKYVGAYLAVLGGADVVTFTAGVGENVSRVRADSLAGLDRLGLRIDAGLNEERSPGPRRISAPGSRIEVLVVPTNEELSIARQVVDLVD